MAIQIDKERRKKNEKKTYIVIGSIVYILVLLAFLHSSVVRVENPRMDFMDAFYQGLMNIVLDPLEILRVKAGTVMTSVMVSLLGGCFLVMFLSDMALRKHDNPETVNGEAHLMNLDEMSAYNKRFSSPLGQERNDGENNMIISKDIRLAIDNRGTRRNCNILVIGGSGAGKSRFFAAPNILQYNANFVITDPSGEMLRDYGKALEDNGFEVKVFNLTDVYRSNRYNPFHYIKEEKDVFILVNTLIKNTTPSEGKGGDPFWEKSENLLLSALILYLWHVYPEEQQTFTNVTKLIGMADVDENDATAQSPLDMLFSDLEKEDPENLAVKQYQKFKLGAGKTMKSILISVGVRLQTFDLSDIKYLTSTDDFEFERFSDTKQALFVIIPTADTTFNFLVSLLYSQLFSSLYTYAETRAGYGWKASIDELTNIRVIQANNKKESKQAKAALEKYVREIKKGVRAKYDKKKKLYKIYTKTTNELVGWRGTKELATKFIGDLKNIKIEKCGNRCPNHVRLILDEFANIGQIPDFDQKLATMRKYEISCSIILQALSQLKDIYKDKWNTIVSNCDTKLFLGCDDTDTIEWMLKMLGKKTTTVENTSWQAQGNGSTSYNKSSLELLTIDQISMMQDDECLVRIRGVRPHYGKKFELTQHKNYAYAKKVEGCFEIPLSDAVVAAKPRGPLRLRNQNQAASNAALKAEGSTTGKPKSLVQEKQLHLTPEAEQNIRTKKNQARKDTAKEARKELADFDQKDSEILDNMISNGFMENLHITPNSSDEEIKEAIASIISLEDPPDDVFIYSMTN